MYNYSWELFWNFDNSRTLCSLQSKVIWPVNDFSYILNYYVIKAISQFISFCSILPLISFHFYKSLQHWHEWWVLWVETKKEVGRNKNGCPLGVVSALVVQIEIIIQKKYIHVLNHDMFKSFLNMSSFSWFYTLVFVFLLFFFHSSIFLLV